MIKYACTTTIHLRITAIRLLVETGPQRPKSKLTVLLILRELVIKNPKDQRSMAEPVGITPQGISDYLKKMEHDGLVDPGSKPPKATIRGVDMLQRDLLQLKDFIDRSIDGLEIVRSTDAIAASKVKKGDRLRIFINYLLVVIFCLSEIFIFQIIFCHQVHCFRQIFKRNS